MVINTWVSEYSHRLSLNLALKRELEFGDEVVLLDLSALASPVFGLLHRKYWLMFPRLHALRKWLKASESSHYISPNRILRLNSRFATKIQLKSFFSELKWKRPSLLQEDVLWLSKTIHDLWLDARGFQLAQGKKLTYWLISRSIQKAIQVLRSNRDLLKEFDVVFLYNGRFPVDSFISKRLQVDKTIEFFECGMRHETLTTYRESTHSYREHRRKALDIWDRAHRDERDGVAVEFLLQRVSYDSKNYKYWNRHQEPTFLRDLPEDKKIVSFFLSSEGELNSIPSENKKTLTDDQWIAIRWLLENLDETKYHLVVKGHPRFTKVGAVDPFHSQSWTIDQIDRKITYIEANAMDDSIALLKRSHIVCVYDSSIGMDAIFHELPLIIFGAPFFSSILPRRHTSLEDVSFEDIGNLIYSKQVIYPWAYYLASSGEPLLF